VRTPVAFWESGEETEVWVLFCEDPVLLPDEEPLPVAVAEAGGSLKVSVVSLVEVLERDVPVASAVSVKAVPVAEAE
jgi:hypothetical protein